MNPIFRKIRKKMADENKPVKYMRYAIGEIVLVVIGILIALQINNWNEQRKLNSTIKSVYSIIKSDLQSDIKNIDLIEIRMNSQDSTFKKVIGNKMTADDYQSCEKCIGIISGYPDLVLENRGLKLLEDNSAIFDPKKDSLILKINSFYSLYNVEISIAMLEMNRDFANNYTYWKNNMPWFNEYYKLNEDASKKEELIAYALTSDYRNRVGSFYLLHYKIYLEHLIEYKKNALIVIENIDQKIG